MQVDQNLVDQMNGKNHAKHVDPAMSKGIANYIQQGKGPQVQVGGFVDAIASAPAYRKSSAELGMFADDTVIGGAGVYNRPEGEESLAELAANPSDMTPEQRHNQMAVLANTASPEDFKKMQEEGFDINNTDTSTIVTVNDKIKAALVQSGKYIEGYTDTLSKEELSKITGNPALAEKIVRALKTHDLPVTEDNVADSVKALNQVRSMGKVSDSSIAYMLKNDLTPSISNLYNAGHMGVGTAGAWGAGVGADFSGMDAQIRKIVEESGLEANKQNMEAGKWLLSNQIPVTGKNLNYMQQLQQLSGELKGVDNVNSTVTENLLDSMAAAIAEGGRPENGMLVEGYSIQDRAKQAYDIIHSATKEDLAYCIANNEPLTVSNLSVAMTARDSQAAPNAEVAHILEMSQRDEELGIGTANPQLDTVEEEPQEVNESGLTSAEEQALAAKMMGGGPVEAPGLSVGEMDNIVAKMTMPPQEPEYVPKVPQKTKGGQVDFVTDGKTANPNYRDPNRGNMVNMTTDDREAMGNLTIDDYDHSYEYSSKVKGALHTTRTNNGTADYMGNAPTEYMDYTGYTSGMSGMNPGMGMNPYMGMPGMGMMPGMMGMNPYMMGMMNPYMMGMMGMPNYAGGFPMNPENYADYNFMAARATTAQHREMNQRISMITSQRQLEEARLVMSMQANQSLMTRGVAIDVRPLEQLVNDLRTQEFYYYQGLLQGNGIQATEERINIFANTTRMITEMQYQPAYILDVGSSMSTIPKLHAAGHSMQSALAQANQSYESMRTRPNEELGDSFSQAFQNVDEILKDMGLEASDGNRRAVRILSYNHTELTPENIQQMKAADEEVQRTFKNLTPAVTMEMIRQNKNPLDMSIEEVNRLAEEIKRDQGDDEIDRFSRYLYKLEMNDKISDEERSGYIGIYRLISQVQKTDGAAIGYLVNQGAKVTMRNLLTAVRSAQRGTIDYEIGDKVEGRAPKTVSARIDNQIEAAFQQNCIRDVAEQISPQKVKEITQEKLMDMSPEELKEAVETTPDDMAAEDAYIENEYAHYSEAMNATEDVYAFLDRYDMPTTMLNIVAASRMLRSPSKMFKEIWKGGAIHAVAEMKKEALNSFGEALKNPDELQEAEERLAESAENALKEMVEEENSVRSMDIKEMRILSRQFQMCAKRAQEECYMVPMRLGRLITGVSLKVIRGKKEKGLVDVLFDNNKTGKLAASFEARDKDIVGFVAVDRESACKHLNENIESLIQSVAGEDAEHVKMQIVYAPDVSLESYEMKSIKWEQRQRARGDQAEEGERNPVQTRRLYKIAENFLGGMQEVLKSM